MEGAAVAAVSEQTAEGGRLSQTPLTRGDATVKLDCAHLSRQGRCLPRGLFLLPISIPHLPLASIPSPTSVFSSISLFSPFPQPPLNFFFASSSFTFPHPFF